MLVQVPFWKEEITAENSTAKATEEIEMMVLRLFLQRFRHASFTNIVYCGFEELKN